MTYELARSYLASLNESRIKPGLERITEALSALGSPHLKFPHILVGGTNGKGSVVSFMGAALSAAGHRVGLFTSPHLCRFEERIAVGDRAVSEDELPGLVQAVKGVGIELTYFEFATAMALLYFATQGVDLAILEVGLGGRWDATNAGDPVLSIITSIDLDHQGWLGHSLEEIALEKSGIMRKGKPVVVGPMDDSAGQVVLGQAEEMEARVLFFGREFRCGPDVTGGGMEFEGMKWNIRRLVPGMKGFFQFANAACALAGLEYLSATGFEVSEEEASRGIESAKWPGRFHQIEGHPAIIVDSAHNPAAVRKLVVSLDGPKHLIWLFSALRDKDIAGMAREMKRAGNHFVLVPLDHARARTVPELADGLPQGAVIHRAASVRQGVGMARQLAGETGCVVVAGSVVLAGEVLRELGIRIRNASTREPGQ